MLRKDKASGFKRGHVWHPLGVYYTETRIVTVNATDSGGLKRIGFPLSYVNVIIWQGKPPMNDEDKK